MNNIRNTWKNKPGVVILSVLLILVILMLLAVLLVRGVINKSESRSAAEAPIASATIVATSADQAAAATATNTKVVSTKIAPTSTPMNTPTPKRVTATPTKRPPTATKTPTSEFTKTPTPKPVSIDTPTAPSPQMDDVLHNGHFDTEFADNGVATGWTPFSTDGAIISFEAETWEPAIENGDFAQRITIAKSTQQDAYAGIYQTVNVVAGESYSLTLYGQIRTPFGDVEKSNYGYRLQYAIDWTGGTNWQAIPGYEWIELPWDEQLIDGENLFFLDYGTEVIPPNNKLTLFVRAWKKWPNDVGGQFTIDSFTMEGRVPTAMTDNALPETGGVERPALTTTDPRLWVSVLILIVLIGGALWKQRHAFRR